ncbi:hypothetical protein V1279_006684 [Bradyrhizobium sp. AZCC 1610]|uniref:hypothetical protein n=1 Tax=Bradyrhizobium sp. AZCC 1610 TaxID=3117020 RepID=UPI002FF3BE49
MASLRPPGLGPVVGATTDSTCRIWIRAGDPAIHKTDLDEYRRTIGVIGMLNATKTQITDAWYFRLRREFDRAGTFTLGEDVQLGFSFTDWQDLLAKGVITGPPDPLPPEAIPAFLEPGKEYTVRCGTLTIDDPTPAASLSDWELIRRLPDINMIKGDLFGPNFKSKACEATFRTFVTAQGSGLMDEAETRDVPPPIPPKQGHGPHFEINERGVISFAPPQFLDRQGNNVDRLRKLHPNLRDISTGLVTSLGAGNVPHWHLRDRAIAYSKLVDQKLEDIDFALLYVEGVRLANADRATKKKISEEELPSLDTQVHEAVESLLHLHGTFVLSTAAGTEFLADEERFQRNPKEEIEYREAAVEFARSLQNKPHIIDQAAAAFVLGTTEEIGKGSNLERSGVVADATIKNVAITVSTAAVLAALSAGAVASGSAALIVGAGATVLVAGEGLKRSKSFEIVASLVTRGLDKASDTEIAAFFNKLAEHSTAQLGFVISLESQLRRLAAKGRELNWLNQTLDWIKNQSKRHPPPSK